MTLVTTRPDATVQNGTGSTIGGGAGSRHAALNDDSDATYVQLAVANLVPANGDSTNEVIIGFAEPSIPGTARLLATVTRMRAAVPGSGSDQGTFRVRRFVTTTEKSNDQVVVTWHSPTTVYVPSFTTDAGADIRVGFGLYSKSAGGIATFRVYELFMDTYYSAQPVATVTAPTGTYNNTNNPAVTWTEVLDVDGGNQTKYRVKIFSAAQYGAGGFNPETSASTYDSGEQEGAALSFQPDVDLADATYRAYVKVAQNVSGDFWSAWAYLGFTIAVNRPGAPSLTLTPQNNYGRVKIDLDDTAGTATTSWYKIERSTDGGTTYTRLRTLLTDGKVVPNGSGQATLYDYEGGNGATVKYRVRGVHDFGSGFTSSGPYTTSANSGWIDDDHWWLKHPTQPELNLAVVIRSQPGHTRSSRRGVMHPLGRKFPIVITDTRTSDEGEVVFRLASATARAALDDLLDAVTGPLLLEGPVDAEWIDRWVSLGDLSEDRALDTSWGAYTFDTLEWTEVEAPVGSVTAWVDPVPVS